MNRRRQCKGRRFARHLNLAHHRLLSDVVQGGNERTCCHQHVARERDRNLLRVIDGVARLEPASEDGTRQHDVPYLHPHCTAIFLQIDQIHCGQAVAAQREIPL
eukprot:7263524-Prymnesium_polylepis.1